MTGELSQLSVAVAVPVEDGAVEILQMAVTFNGHVITGAVLSSTTIVALHVEVLPQSSDAVHVLVRVYDCAQVPGKESVANVKATVASQASVAIAKPKEGVVPHSIGLTTIGQVITGGVVSSTLMVCRHTLVLPEASVAVHVRVIVYACAHGPAVVISA